MVEVIYDVEKEEDRNQRMSKRYRQQAEKAPLLPPAAGIMAADANTLADRFLYTLEICFCAVFAGGVGFQQGQIWAAHLDSAEPPFAFYRTVWATVAAGGGFFIYFGAKYLFDMVWHMGLKGWPTLGRDWLKDTCCVFAITFACTHYAQAQAASLIMKPLWHQMLGVAGYIWLICVLIFVVMRVAWLVIELALNGTKFVSYFLFVKNGFKFGRFTPTNQFNWLVPEWLPKPQYIFLHILEGLPMAAAAALLPIRSMNIVLPFGPLKVQVWTGITNSMAQLEALIRSGVLPVIGFFVFKLIINGMVAGQKPPGPKKSAKTEAPPQTPS